MQIVTTKTFDKQFAKQPKKVQQEFERRIKIFLKNDNTQLLHIHKLRGAHEGLWSMNVTGDIRVIFDKAHEPTILLVAIGSHRELYS